MSPHVPIDWPTPTTLRSPGDPWQRKVIVTVALSSWTGVLRDAHRAAGFQVVAVLLDNDPQAAENRKELERIRPQLERAGWRIAGWAPTYDVGAAVRAAELARSCRLCGWGANLEAWAEGEQRWLTPAWVGAFRTRQPNLPLLVSCLSSDTDQYAREFDYDVCLRAGATIGPQVYGSNEPGLTVQAMLGSLELAGVPPHRVAPWFSVDKGPVPTADYASWDGPYGVWTGEAFHDGAWSSSWTR